MKKTKCKQYRTSALFECLVCGEQWQDLRTARQEAYNHAKKTGHKVRGEIGTAYHYTTQL